MDYGKPSLADALAAEYVAGTLRGAARRRFEALRPSHPALDAAVLRWQARLMPLTEAIEPVAPPPQAWRAIEQRLWPVPAAVAVPAVAPAGGWRSLALWRGLTALAGVAALALAVVLGSAPPPQAPVIVVLQGTGADAAFGGGFVAGVSADGRALVAQPIQPVALAADRVLELWSVPPEGGGNPRSLGLIKADGVTVLARERLPATLLEGGTALLAVSVEPPGGSPTGVPTGPVVYAGPLKL
jgi:anti-sigma-K factor RskA